MGRSMKKKEEKEKINCVGVNISGSDLDVSENYCYNDHKIDKEEIVKILNKHHNKLN